MSLYPESAIILAPLAGYTDLPYRASARRHGCQFCFTEMIDAGSLAFGNWHNANYLKRGEDETWLGVQLVGSNPEWLIKSVEIINNHHFDVLDFNLGCPVPKVTKKGAGAALGKNIPEAERLFSMIAAKSRLPVSAKIRILSVDDPAPTVELVRRLENAGAVAVTIHGRVSEAFYSGSVHCGIIAAVKNNAKIQIIANGGVMGTNGYELLRRDSGCQAVMVARGAMGNPWIFRELSQLNQYRPPDINELCTEIELHVNETMAMYGETTGLVLSRKNVLDYLRGRGFPGTLRAAASYLATTSQFQEFIARTKAEHTDKYREWLAKNPNAERRLATSSSKRDVRSEE
jgi:tRNA-dihydrouridine synthase B